MNIMNKKILLLTILLPLSLRGYGQVYDIMADSWVEGMYYPVSATQFEQNIGVKDLFFTGWGVTPYKQGIYVYDESISGMYWFCPDNLASKTIPFGYIENCKDDVMSITIKRYMEVEKWEKKSWEERESKTYQFDKDNILIDGKKFLSAYFSVLNSKGQKEKIYEGPSDVGIRFKYQRDELGRVVTVYTYNRQELYDLYKYTYNNPKDSNRITKIERFSPQGKCVETVEFIYDGLALIAASMKNSEEQKSLKYTYNTNGDVLRIQQYKQKEYMTPFNTVYDFAYVYTDGKISSCECRWGTGEYQFETWDFKYDSKGNWVEILVKPTNIKWVREINYGQ